jgi:hypothetical protein
MEVIELPTSRGSKRRGDAMDSYGVRKPPDPKRTAAIIAPIVIEYEQTMPFFFRHLLGWRMPLTKGGVVPDYSVKTEEICVDAGRYHPEMSICVDHGRIWQSYGGLGIANLDDTRFPDQPCGVCKHPELYKYFINAVQTAVQESKHLTPVELRARWHNSQSEFLKRRLDAMKDSRKHEPGVVGKPRHLRAMSLFGSFV